jgi:hypothetical protein
MTDLQGAHEGGNPERRVPHGVRPITYKSETARLTEAALPSVRIPAP